MAMFATLTEAKDFMNITVSTTDDAITKLIEDVTRDMQRYMDRLILKTTHTDERHNGMGQTSLTLKEYPVTVTGSEVAVLREDGTVITATNYAVDGDSGVVQLKDTRFLPSRWEIVGVDYESGFVFGVPDDLNQAGR